MAAPNYKLSRYKYKENMKNYIGNKRITYKI